MIVAALFVIAIGVWGISHSIDRLRVKLTEIYNHSLHVDEE